MSKPQNAIPSLDGLRAVSFLLVFVAHAGLEKYVPGGFGVTIFFFLSGFLITTLMRLEYSKTGQVNLAHFWLRRVLRIFPPFYLVLLTTIIATLVLDPGLMSLHAMIAQLAFFTNYWLIYHGYGNQPPGTGVFWSLAVEEHFYLLFPWLYVVMQWLKLGSRNQAFFLWGLCAVVVTWRIILVYGFHVLDASVVPGATPVDRTYMATDTRIDSILFGCALAVWNNPVIDKFPAKDFELKYLMLPASFALLLASLLIRDDHFRETLRYTLQGIGLTGLFVAAIKFPSWGLFKVLNWKPLMFIGTLSYSLYLIHNILLMAMATYLAHLQPVLRGLLCLAVAIAISYGIYRTIEKPCAQLRRRLGSINASPSFFKTGRKESA